MADSNRSGVGFTSYSVDADNAFQRALEQAKANVEDLRPAFSEIARDFYKSQKAIWQLKGPGRYPDLNEKYKIAKKKDVGFVYPILKRTGKLEKAASQNNAPGNITVIGRQSLLMGVYDSVIPYAKYHQSDEERSKIPLRKFLFIGPEGKTPDNDQLKGRVQRWTSILEVWVLKLTKEAGLGE